MFKLRHISLPVALVALALAVAPSVGAAPTLAILAPTQGAVVQGTSVTVRFQTDGFRVVQAGPGATQSVTAAGAGSEPQGQVNLWLDLWPVAVVSQGDSYTFTSVPAGEHQLRAELVSADRTAVTAPVVQQVRFRTESALTQAQSAAVMARTGVGLTADTTAGPLPLVAMLALVAMVGGVALRKRNRVEPLSPSLRGPHTEGTGVICDDMRGANRWSSAPHRRVPRR